MGNLGQIRFALWAVALAGCAVAASSPPDGGYDLSGEGDLSSPCQSGQHLCAATHECVPLSVCCSSADCTVKGQACPGIGATCACPPGKHVCTSINTCIADGTCCSTAECTNGQNCINGSCGCDPGTVLCAAQNKCIPVSACCSDSDCPATAQTTGTSCNGANACTITGCNAGYTDYNTTYADGCECGLSTFGQTCAARTALNTVAVGGSIVRNGNLLAAGSEDWFSVTFAYSAAATYHPHIALVAAPGTTMLMDVSTSCSAVTCGLTGGAAMVDWEAKGGGDAGSLTYVATPSVGTLIIRVYQTAGQRGCGQYKLTISN